MNVEKMNVLPGGKQPAMRDTTWQERVQQMVYPDGTPKGMKAILEERGVNTRKMKVNDMRKKLSQYPDFQNQKTLLEEYIESRGHICIYFPKFHCELRAIERVWSHSKKHTHAYGNRSMVCLRRFVLKDLTASPLT